MKYLATLFACLIAATATAQIPLRQSTARDVLIGPFLDRTDGVTAEDTLEGNGGNLETNVQLSKNGAAFAARNSTTDPTDRTSGWYLLPLSTTDTNTLGPLVIECDDATTYLPFRATFIVMEANTYDSLYPDATATPDDLDVAAVIVSQIEDDVITELSIADDAIGPAEMAPSAIGASELAAGAIDAGAFSAGAIDNTAFNVTETLTANPAAGGIAAASFSAGAIDASAIAANALGASEFAADAVDEIFDEPLAGHATAGTAGKALTDAAAGAGGGGADFDDLLADHNDPDTFGAAINEIYEAILNAEDIEDLAAAIANAAWSDFNDEAVPPNRTWTPTATASDVLADVTVKVVPIGESPTFAIDFKNDLPAGGQIATVDSVTIFSGTAGGVTFGTATREDSQAKVRITGVTAGTYIIEVDVTYSSGSTQTARVTCKAVQ